MVRADDFGVTRVPTLIPDDVSRETVPVCPGPWGRLRHSSPPLSDLQPGGASLTSIKAEHPGKKHEAEEGRTTSWLDRAEMMDESIRCAFA